MPNFIFEMNEEEKVNVVLTPNVEAQRNIYQKNRVKNDKEEYEDPVYNPQTFLIPKNFVWQLPKSFFGDEILSNPYNDQLRARIMALPMGYAFKNEKLLTHFEALKKAKILLPIEKETKDTHQKKAVTQNIGYETAEALIPKKGCDLFLLNSQDEITALSLPDSIKSEAKVSNTPILIHVRDMFYIYGCLNGKDWSLTEVRIFSHQTRVCLESLPFEDNVIRRDDPRFNDLLVSVIKQGHIYPRAQIWVMLGKSNGDDLLCILSDPKSEREIIEHYREDHVAMWDWAYVSPENFPTFIQYVFDALIKADKLHQMAFFDINKNPILTLSQMIQGYTRVALDTAGIVANYLGEESEKCKNVFIRYGIQEVSPKMSNEELPVIPKSLTMWKAKESDVDRLFGICAAGVYKTFEIKLLSKDFNIQTLGATLEKISSCTTQLKPKIIEKTTALINKYLNTDHKIDDPDKIELLKKEKQQVFEIAKHYNLAVTMPVIVNNDPSHSADGQNMRHLNSPGR